MGSEMTVEQERCLDPYPLITVALDNDAARNRKGLRHLRESQKRNHRVSKARLIG